MKIILYVLISLSCATSRERRLDCELSIKKTYESPIDCKRDENKKSGEFCVDMNADILVFSSGDQLMVLQ